MARITKSLKKLVDESGHGYYHRDHKKKRDHRPKPKKSIDPKYLRNLEKLQEEELKYKTNG